jgi:glycosyltransferase involved in cell wall biosynthesis
MKILLIHNRYLQAGGEDAVFDFESSLLAKAGHSVSRLAVSNNDLTTPYRKLKAALTLQWNPWGFSLVRDAVAKFSPDVMHVHNTFPLLSPAIYDAAAASGVPVVQTLHNFRLTCANGMLLRNNAPCERCIVGTPFNAVRYRCYRGSYLASAAVAKLIAAQRRNQVWAKVSRFIALSEFSRSIFVSAGLPAEKISIKPNSVADGGQLNAGTGTSVLFVGRLSEEKGIRTLIEIAAMTGCNVRVVGDGPLKAELMMVAPRNVVFLGQISHHEVLQEMSRAKCLVLPSTCYENCSVALIEAYSVGLPVIASKIGSFIEYVEDGVTGLYCTPNDPTSLLRAIRTMTGDSELAARLSSNARIRYLSQFSPQRTLADLESIYSSVSI